jgi:hypothetical protein
MDLRHSKEAYGSNFVTMFLQKDVDSNANDITTGIAIDPQRFAKTSVLAPT